MTLECLNTMAAVVKKRECDAHSSLGRLGLHGPSTCSRLCY